MIYKKYIENFRSHQRGQGLVETIIALSIIIAAIAACISLAIAGLAGVHQSKMRIIAANLAREGIEVFRNVRDSNWLGDTAWDEGLGYPNDIEAIAVFDPTTAPPTWQVDFGPDSFEECIEENTCRLSLGKDIYNGIYTHQTGQYWEETPFYRFITLTRVCDNRKLLKNCGEGNFAVGIQILSTVRWIEKGRTNEIIVEEWIYNWK